MFRPGSKLAFFPVDPIKIHETGLSAAAITPVGKGDLFPMSNLVLDNPFLEYLDARHVGWKEGYAEFRMPIQPKHLNRRGVLQGGVVATLLDAACGYSGLYAPEDEPARHGFTLSLTVNYLDTGLGESVTAKGFIERQGRSIFFSRGEAWVDDKILIASAQGTFKSAGLKKG
jgi:uncharacterized protein (TIGR00369 family)